MFDLEMIKNFYEAYTDRVLIAKKKLDRSLTFSEKILFGHLDTIDHIEKAVRGSSYIDFNRSRSDARCNSSNGTLAVYDGG